jgi:hypothetical protein
LSEATRSVPGRLCGGVTEGGTTGPIRPELPGFYPPHWRALSQREWFEPMVVEYLSHLGQTR